MSRPERLASVDPSTDPSASIVALPSRGPVVVSDAARQPEWDGYVESHPETTAYHQWAWRAVFERAFKHKTLYLSAHRDDKIVGVLPLVVFRSSLFGRFAVSLPFVNYGGVLADDERASTALIAHATEAARGQRLAHIEFRHTQRRDERLPFKEHKVAMTLPLPDAVDVLWNGLDRKVRNQVRKAEKSGLVVASGHGELLPAFYQVFAHNMRDLGTPVYARRFFEEVVAQLGDAIRIFVVRHERDIVGAAIAYRYRTGVEIPWASSLAAFRHLSPNNLLYWRMMEWAVATGLRTFDFGRSSPDGGTYHFKKQWGAQATPLAWEYVLLNGQSLPDQSPKNPRFSLAIDLWKRLPLPIANVLGPVLVRSIP